jgi:hypothetical protein
LKPNALISKIEAKYNALFHLKMDMLMQMGQDAAMIAAHEVLQLGPGRSETFCTAYIEAMNGMARMVCEDQQDDSEFVYAKAKIDEQIRAIVGDDLFKPWEERYGRNL